MAQYETVRRAGAGARTAQIDEGLRAHMSRVYGLMSFGMAVTGLIAYFIGADLNAYRNGGATTFLSPSMIETMYGGPVRWVIMLAPLAIVFMFGAAINKLSENAARGIFILFAGLMGLSLASIFAIYTGVSIAQTFFVTAIAFLSLSLWGYTTKKDISGWGSFLIMGVIGLIVAMVVNWFLQSEAIMFAISALGVLIFAGLTAYDTQNIKNTYIAMASNGQSEWLGKAAIMGALSLYINFLNMFQFLLMFMGNQE